MSNTITLPQTLIKRLEKLSAGSRHTPEPIVRQAAKNQIEYEEWKLAQIDAGLAELKAGKGIPDAEFWGIQECQKKSCLNGRPDRSGTSSTSAAILRRTTR